MGTLSLAGIVQLAIPASVMLLVFALGLSSTAEQATYLLRRPGKLARAVLSMYVIVPGFVVLVAWAFEFRRPVEIALLAAALSPVPPILPGKQLKMGGRPDYVYGLLIAMSLIAVVTIPLAVQLVGWVFARDARMDAVQIARLIGISVLVPLILGIVVRRVNGAWAATLAPVASKLGTVALALAVLPLLITSLPAMWQVAGEGTILLIIGLVAGAIATGHVLAGPDPAERLPLGIASAMRHPGVALAIARRNIQDEPLVPAAILMALILAGIATTVYGRAMTNRARSG
jgi:BASS family bile acid:Na+ symporter